MRLAKLFPLFFIKGIASRHFITDFGDEQTYKRPFRFCATAVEILRNGLSDKKDSR
jgi:hypothetical protein